ncbi:MAG: calcineurin-like phosphoesterase C-terminal domain-containing protein [Bacteroidales bacterium]|nr:calcineurin-like phosphoesterase C-terminal domain-containing protein [Bacteroidales bacterium]
MKRALLIIGILFSCAGAWARGIGSAKDLKAYIETSNKGGDVSAWCNADGVVVLTADIDLSKVKKLPQIEVFGGHFDGQGHRLLKWKATAGLFKLIEREGLVEGLIIDKSCSLKVSSGSEEYKVGFIADFNNGNIRNCVNEGTITHKCKYLMAPAYVGGLVGYNKYIILDCKNTGNISSDTSGENKESVSIAVGGICGGGTGKANTVSSIVRCENEGAINVISNVISYYAGGIAGNAGRSQLKVCVNRGAVTADIRETEDGNTTAGIARAGGIAGLAKANILRCENFGNVTTKGACGGYAGGIVGAPHDILVMADCVNYGTIVTAGEQVSHTGGIAGNISRQVHVRGCSNYGKVRFEGVSSRARSTAGGIVGNIHVPKSQDCAAYVRECINYGEVSSASGGNKYDSTNRNSIHTAGVVGCAESRPGLRGCVIDCGNFGKVSAESGRRADICASAVNVATGGSAPDNWAVSITKVPAQGNITGTVLTPSGDPWKGVVVTDGRQCVRTDAKGRYAMTSNLDEVRFVYLSIPANAVIPTRHGMPATFKRIPRHSKAVVANFTLQPRESANDYTVLMIADPQVRPFGWDNSMETWHQTVAPDAEAFRASIGTDVYCINLGDLVYNEMSAWDDYLDGADIIKCPTFNVIGNHDYDQFNLFDTSLGDICYQTYVGPTRYSFDLGRIHYLVFNDILYDRKDSGDKYHYGIDRETLDWIKADLAYVPYDRTIVTCTHHNPFKTPNKSPHGSHNAYSLNYQEYLDLFSQYWAVYAWNGHNHQNFYYNYEGKNTRHGAPNIQCISVARATGALRFNAPIASLGEPQGYMVLNVHGESLDWYYKGVGTGQDCQMRAYPPSYSSDGSVQVTIWNYSEGWSRPAWYENGVKVADMDFAPGKDPAYEALFETVTNKTTRKYCKPLDEALIFKVKPSRGVSSGEIRVTDLFGNTYTQSVNW